MGPLSSLQREGGEQDFLKEGRLRRGPRKLPASGTGSWRLEEFRTEVTPPDA